MKLKRIFLILFVVFSTALSGCASRSVQKDFSFASEKDKGLIVISIDHDRNVPRGTSAHFYITDVQSSLPRLRLQTGGREFEDSYGQLLVFDLPPGRYQVAWWRIEVGTGAFISPKGQLTPLVFEVRAGEVIYLGNLHFNFSTGKNIFRMTLANGGYPEVRDRRDRDIPIFESRYPQFRQKVTYDLFPLGPCLLPEDTSREMALPPVLPVAPLKK